MADSILKFKSTLSVREAGKFVSPVDVESGIAVICDAIQLDALPAALVLHQSHIFDWSKGVHNIEANQKKIDAANEANPPGTLDIDKTMIDRANLQAWGETIGLFNGAAAKKAAKHVWTDAENRELLKKKKEGATQEKLSEEYGISRQRIGSQLKKAEQSLKRPTDPFSALHKRK